MAEHHHEAEYDMKHVRSTELILRTDILAKTKQLAETLANSDEVRTYQEAEQKLQGHERVQALISAIKKKQKEIVGFEYFKNDAMVKKIEAEIEELQNELDSIPIVQQFQQTQHDINYMLQLVVSVIQEKLSEKINVETGTSVPPSHCGD